MADIRLENSERLILALERIPMEALDRNALLAACLAGARILRPEVAQRAPLDSGFLKANIVAWKGLRKDLPAAAFVTIRKKTQGGAPAIHPRGRTVRSKAIGEPFYARFLERGTDRMRARPFFAPAFAAREAQAVAAIEAALQKRFDAFIREVSA